MSESINLEAAFRAFLHYKAGKSENTLRAYRNDLNSITAQISSSTGIDVLDLTVADAFDKYALREAFAHVAANRSKATLRRCWSTWHVFGMFLVKDDLLVANPMPDVGKDSQNAPPGPPKSIEPEDVEAMLLQLAMPDPDDVRGWRERDLVIVLLGLLMGLRSAEMRELKVGDFTPSGDDSGAMIVTIRGKGNKVRQLAAEASLVAVIEVYLRSRLSRFPDHLKTTRRGGTSVWNRLRPDAPLLVGANGAEMTRGTLQYRTKRAYQKANIPPARGANTHRLRHTFAIALADEGVPIHVLSNLLGHSSLNTALKYLEASGRSTRLATNTNPIYQIADRLSPGE